MVTAKEIAKSLEIAVTTVPKIARLKKVQRVDKYTSRTKNLRENFLAEALWTNSSAHLSPLPI